VTIYEFNRDNPPRNAFGSVCLNAGQIWGVCIEAGGIEWYRLIEVYLYEDKPRVGLLRLHDEELVSYSVKYFRKYFDHKSDLIRFRNEEMEKEVKKWRALFRAISSTKRA
jgi:hypothetical protein